MSKAQAAAEGIYDKWQEIVKLVQSGLDSEVVKRAVASGRYYREVFVGAPLEKRLVEGFIDLLFEEDGSLVIADYKTDALDNEEEEMKREKQYSLQAGTYAFTVEQVTGSHVKEVVLVFLRSARKISKVNIDSLTFETRQRIISIFNDNGG
jgi:ATP-dependent helicase/nuclease subunit A